MSKLYRYSEKEINNFRGGKVTIANNQKDIIKFINKSKIEKDNSKLYLGKIGNDLAQRIKKDINIDIENYNISLKSDSVRHILNRHSSNNEFLKGQVPIVDEDFKLISKIISNYDKIRVTGLTKQRKPIITVEKLINNKYYLVNYISNKNHTFEIKTMYKHKKKNSATGDNAK